MFLMGMGVFLCADAEAVPPTWVISGVVETAAGTGVEGVDVVGDNGATSAVTAADGSYSITVPNHWDGTVTVSKAGWLITPVSKSYSNVRSDFTGENYTAYQPCISGVVTKADGTPLEGVNITADNSGGVDTTDGDGYYEFHVPYNWSGTVSATLADYYFADKSYSDVISDQINQDYSGYQPTICGIVRKSDGTPLAGVTVTADNGGSSDTTDGSGYYQVTLPYGWSGTVTCIHSAYLFEPRSKHFTDLRENVFGQDFAAVESYYGGGTGNSEDPYVISDPNHLLSLGLCYWDWNSRFIMTQDIDLESCSSSVFNLIGNGPMVAPGSLAIDEENEIIYFVDGKAICSVQFDGKGWEKIIDNLAQPQDLAFDFRHGKLYWNDVTDKNVKRANVDGSEIEVCVSDYSPEHMAFDAVNQRIYWSNNGVYTINYCDPDGNNPGFISVSQPATCLSVDTVNGKLYWIGWAEHTIRRANLDGSSPEVLYVAADYVQQISVDPVNNKIYWVQSHASLGGTIRRCNFDGTDVENVVEGINWSGSIKVTNDGYVYWSARNSKSIKRLKIQDLSQQYVIASFFSGVFDGNHYAISNITYTAADSHNVGFFSTVGDPNAVICNLTIVDPNIISYAVEEDNVLACSPLVGVLYDGSILNCAILGGHVTGDYSVGSIAGQSSGLIHNCISSCQITGNSQVGGLVGYNKSGNIENCTFLACVENFGDNYVGGITGINSDEATVIDCNFIGDIYSTSVDCGGIAGYSNGSEIDNCRASGYISGSGYVGGIVGSCSYTWIYNSSARCDIGGTGIYVGGITGKAFYGGIEKSFSESTIQGLNDVGGVAGYVYYTWVTNCYSTGAVTGDNSVGGLIGRTSSGKITNCYSTGSVVGTGTVGGLISSGSSSSDYYVKNCYWDTENSGQATSYAGTGKMTLEMQQLDTFVAWACDGSWTIDEGDDYPRLNWEQKTGIPIVPVSYWGRSGEPNDPIELSTPNHLQALTQMPCVWDKHFVLVNDVDMQGQEICVGAYNGVPFTGVFDGNNHSISKLNNPSGSLFLIVDDQNTSIRDITLINPVISGKGSLIGTLNNGIVENCHVQNGYVNGGDYTGGLIGDSYQSVIDCSFEGQVYGEDQVGGLIGRMEKGSISNCDTSGNVSGAAYVGGVVGFFRGEHIVNCTSECAASGTYITGGLAGRTSGMIENSVATGNVGGGAYSGGLAGWSGGIIRESEASGIVTGGPYTGGFVGSNAGEIVLCRAYGNVIGQSEYTGGFAGQNYLGTIKNSFAQGNVEGNSNNVGGFVGLNWKAEVRDCHAEGDVMGNANDIGGLIGINQSGSVYNSYSQGNVAGDDGVGGGLGAIVHYGDISNCYASGGVQGDQKVGGFVGRIYVTYEGEITISKSYSYGKVNGNTEVGGFIGRIDTSGSSTVSVVSSFWDVETSGQTSSALGGGSPRLTTSMKTLSTFVNAGWDFTTPVWVMLREGEDYPRLVWQTVFAGDIAGLYGVNLVDLAYLGRYWGLDDCEGADDCGRADIDASGDVGIVDLASVVDDWMEGL